MEVVASKGNLETWYQWNSGTSHAAQRRSSPRRDRRRLLLPCASSRCSAVRRCARRATSARRCVRRCLCSRRWLCSSHALAPVLAPADAAPAAPAQDDLEKYLALPAEGNLDVDVLAWWKARDHNLAADPATGRPEGLPALAKMARQFLGRPASSAGVERMFSLGGQAL